MIPLEIVDALDSTSDALKRRVAMGLEGEAALMARQQTGGRGRLGRGWTSPQGNLYLSLLLRPGPMRWPGQWSILVAVAVAETVRAHVPNPAAVRIKWPNDVLIDGAKLAGVLLEAGMDAAPWLVIGMGVNLRVAPDGLGRPTATLGEGSPAPEAFAASLLERLDTWRERYRAEGFDPVRQAWLARAHARGERVATTGSTGAGVDRVEGAFAGLAESGAMLLDTAAGRKTVSSGELM